MVDRGDSGNGGDDICDSGDIDGDIGGPENPECPVIARAIPFSGSIEFARERANFTATALSAFLFHKYQHPYVMNINMAVKQT
jgi:hypothetical protein